MDWKHPGQGNTVEPFSASGTPEDVQTRGRVKGRCSGFEGAGPEVSTCGASFGLDASGEGMVSATSFCSGVGDTSGVNAGVRGASSSLVEGSASCGSSCSGEGVGADEAGAGISGASAA